MVNSSRRNLLPALMLISAVGIAYELLFMRIFSIAQWYHFAYMMISVAMLGFGAAGTLISLFGDRVRRRADDLFRMGAWLVAVAVPLCYLVSQWIPFETFRIATERIQWVYLFLLYAVLAVPFFLVSVCITTAFLIYPKHVGRIYFVNMCGSGLGAFGITMLMYLFAPRQLVGVVTAAAFVGFMCSLAGKSLSWLRLGAAAAVVLVLGWGSVVTPPRVSEYKGLSYALDMPDAELEAQAYSPISELSAVTSRYLRETPGQISNYPMSELGPLPAQVGLYFDAGAGSVINEFSGDFRDLAYLDYVTSALPYHLLADPSVFVIGAGGGTDVLMALKNEAPKVTAAEVDPNVFPLVDKTFGDFSGHLYSRPDVQPVLADGRGWLEGHAEDGYDVIHVALLDSFSSSASGVHALSESYLYTEEAIQTYLQSMTDEGVLSVTRWLKTPPRDAVKMFATLVEGAETSGIESPGQHLFWIRSWNTATLVLSKTPLSAGQVRQAKSFCRDRNFDLCYYPGITAGEANRHTILEEPVYFNSAQSLLFGDRSAFYDEFLYYVRPPTDDRPYFFRFFKWASIPRLLRGMGSEWIPFVEWGYLTLLATVIQSLVTSLLLIVVPLVVFSRGGAGGTRGWRLPVVLYFGLLGLAFMFLEIGFIQKLMLFLHYPVYAVAVVLTSFMFFSGLGSLAAEYLQSKAARIQPVGVLVLIVVGLGLVLGARPLFDLAMGWPDAVRIAFALVLLAPLAFMMGLPFPFGLQLVSNRMPRLVPWAWAVNGCLSVTGATLATFTAVHLGFRLLSLLAALCYLGTIPVFRALARPASDDVSRQSDASTG